MCEQVLGHRTLRTLGAYLRRPSLYMKYPKKTRITRGVTRVTNQTWVPPGTTGSGYHRVPGTTGYHRVPPGTTGYHRVPPGTKIGQICDCCPLFTAVTYFIHSECGHAARQRRDNRKTAVNLCNKPLALRLDLDRNHIRDIDMHRPPNEHVYRHGYGHGPHEGHRHA